MKSTFHLLIISFLILCFSDLNAQDGFIQKVDVPVSTNDAGMKYPWVGGLDNPQFSEADLNNDGIQDLVVYDRKDSEVLTFISDGSSYTYDSNYEGTFPEVDGFMLLRDYNCDGIMDLFSSYLLGIRLHQGLYSTEGRLKFILIEDVLKDYSVMPEENIQVYSYDVPSIADINGDGLLDLLTFDGSGARVEYYENTSTDCTELIWTKQTDCWGHFYETMLDAEVLLNDSCTGRLSSEAVHPGSTLTTIDMDADGDMELLLGDITYNHLNLLTNGGTSQNAHIISQDIDFPINSENIELANFPGGYYLDVTFDGVKDLIVSPNQPNLSQNVNCAWLYENEGQDNLPTFTIERKNFITSDMIDVGTESHPVYFDYDVDGDLDVLIGNYTYFREAGLPGQSEDPYGTLTLWKNVGSSDSPAYDLVTEDYAGISALAGYGINDFIFLHPTFGDIDGDGDQDMLLGEQNGYLHLFTNEAPIGFPAFFSLTEYRYQDIYVGKNSTPQLVDVDQDGLLDLIIGEKNANLNFYHNTGTSTSAIYTLISDQWGGVDVQNSGTGSVDGYSVPQYISVTGIEYPILMVGSDKGQIYLYDDVEGNAFNGQPFNLVNDNLIGRVSKRISIHVADADDDGQLDMLIGTRRGGVLWYEQDNSAGPLVNVIEHIQKAEFYIYPNPAEDRVHINWSDSEPRAYIKLMDVNGRTLMSRNINNGDYLELKGISSGIYFLECNFRDRHQIIKLIKTSEKL